MPCLNPKLRIVTTSRVPGARPLATPVNTCRSSCTVIVGRVDDVVGHAR